ncbi:MAG: creatininase family protein [candidate division WOR-3 bacterium]|nr:creatininase family protein [candidate division WOR-3 bacterium]MCX7947215.1 creatininase family protein [candidate division WOR-3 bacterium]MDW8150270.1 creatininase family protein [candidate division WOR-3 bacterium]
MELERISYFKLKELNINRAFLPIGTIEAHGPAPLGTDNYIPYILSKELSKEFNAIVLPTVSYGINKSLDYYLGSMGISEKTFKSLVLDILKSCYKNKFSEIFIFNGHSGNSAIIKEVSYKAHVKYNLKICIIEWWEIAKDIDFFKEYRGHAGIDEVSMVIYAIPDVISEIRKNFKSYTIKMGITNYPNPRSILVDRENIEYALDLEKSREFFLLVKERIRNYILEVIEGWREI